MRFLLKLFLKFLAMDTGSTWAGPATVQAAAAWVSVLPGVGHGQAEAAAAADCVYIGESQARRAGGIAGGLRPLHSLRHSKGV